LDEAIAKANEAGSLSGCLSFLKEHNPGSKGTPYRHGTARVLNIELVLCRRPWVAFACQLSGNFCQSSHTNTADAHKIAWKQKNC